MGGNQSVKIVLLKKIMRMLKKTMRRRDRLCFNLGWEKEIPSDVPKGHIPVYVGNDRSRFIIPATHLNHPLFRQLLDMIEEEMGFCHEMGLFIPCEKAAFEYLVSLINGQKSVRLSELRPEAKSVSLFC
ncbi:hypothetical protein SUGI_0458740 [Cryptomeria japonica]|nr:hypothetical protein SUGI_0458740 [Cryptomeria japonica]